MNFFPKVFVPVLITLFDNSILGVGVGSGLGLIYLPAIVSVSSYFERKRSIAIGNYLILSYPIFTTCLILNNFPKVLLLRAVVQVLFYFPHWLPTSFVSLAGATLY